MVLMCGISLIIMSVAAHSVRMFNNRENDENGDVFNDTLDAIVAPSHHRPLTPIPAERIVRESSAR